ncbi:MAG: methylmalonyl-CoA mutase family protein [Deltaproteobacteria bacterium]
MSKKLFEEFPPVTPEEWKSQIEKDLKGIDLQKLNWRPYEGFTVEPFYTERDLTGLEYLTDSAPNEFPYARGIRARDNRWRIDDHISAENIEDANRLAVESIKQGADSITFICEAGEGLMRGIPIQSEDDVSGLLKNIPIGEIPLHFKCGTAHAAILSLFVNEAEKTGVEPEKLTGSVDADPLGYLALKGTFARSEKDSFEELAAVISYVGGHMPLFKVLKVNGHHFHNSGASITQEVAFTLSSGVEYLDRLTSMDVRPDMILNHMSFSFSVGSNYFMEIAKLRAARLLWAKIAEQYKPGGESSKKMILETRTSSWNKTVFDPYVNMLRTTVEAMAASIGGSETLNVQPMDSTFRTPDEFSRRMARNTQLILKNESYLDRVTDPGAGAYYIENLTDSIAEASWETFLKIEELGGVVEALKSGFIQDEIEKTRNKRDMDIAARKKIFLGVNQYPDINEKMPENTGDRRKEVKLKKSGLEIKPEELNSIEALRDYFSDKNALLGDTVPEAPVKHDVRILPLKPYRGAEPFEKIRLRTLRYISDTGNSPEVFLFPAGNPSMRSARAAFSGNFFGCAGFKIIENTGFKDIETGVKAALKSEARIIVICSSDKEYPDLAPEICKELKAESPDVKVLIAGNPKEHVSELRSCGIDDFIHARSNALELIEKYQEILGIYTGGGENN